MSAESTEFTFLLLVDAWEVAAFFYLLRLLISDMVLLVSEATKTWSISDKRPQLYQFDLQGSLPKNLLPTPNEIALKHSSSNMAAALSGTRQVEQT